MQPATDHLRGGPSHVYNTSCVQKSIGAIVFELCIQTYRQKDPYAFLAFLSGSEGNYGKHEIIMLHSDAVEIICYFVHQ